MDDDDSDTIAPFPQARINELVRRALVKLDERRRRDGLALAEVESGGVFMRHDSGVLVRFLGPRDGFKRETDGRKLRRLHVRGLIRQGSDYALGTAQVVLTAAGREALAQHLGGSV